MKILIFLFSMLFASGYQDSIPDTINGYIEQLRDAIPEPIVVESVHLDLSDSEYPSGFLNISNINLQGLKAFDMNITYLLGLLPNHFVLTIDSIKLDLEYLANSSEFFGEGKASMELANFTVEANLAVSLVPINISINEMHMHLDDAKFVLEGLFYNDSLSNEVSELLTDDITIIFNAYETEISIIVEILLNHVIADIVANMSSTSSQTYEQVATEFNIDALLNDDDYSSTLSDLLSNNVANIFNDQDHGLSILIEDALNKVIADIISNPTLSKSYNEFIGKNPEVRNQLIGEILLSVLNSILPEI